MQKETDEKFMRRCLQLAANGLLTTKPNPMVGAVIVSENGRIIGEGFTSPVGGPHAEVNAFALVRKEDEALLPGALQPLGTHATMLRLDYQQGREALRVRMR